MSIAAIATAVLTLGRWLRHPRPEWPSTPVDRAWAGWALALGLAAAFALDPAASAPRLNKTLFPGLVALATFHTPDRRTGRRALAILFLSSAVASVYGTVFFVAHGASFASRARGPVGHYMTYAEQLLIVVSLALPVALLARERAWRLGALAVAVLGFVALMGTFTRSAWLGLGAAVIVMVAAARPRWLPAVLVAIAAAVTLLPVMYRDRLLSAFDLTHPLNRERAFMWQAGLHMFRDHPLTGVGLQDLHPLYERYRSPEAREGAGHLHSAPIQVAASMGIVGLAAFAWLVASLVRCGGSGLRKMLRQPTLEAGIRLGALAGLIGFLVAGLFEWNFGDEELLYLVYIVAGLAWSARRWETAAA